MTWTLRARSGRRVWHALLALLGALLLLALASTRTRAGLSPIQDALAIVLDPATGQHVGQAAPNVPFNVYVVADSLGGTEMSACQLGVEIDPRFYIVSKTFHPQVVFVDEYVPGDFYLGFGRPLGNWQQPKILITLSLMLKSEYAGANDLRVSLRPHTTGQPLRWAWFPGTSFWYDFVDAGGAVLNPSGPQITTFAAGPRWLVEARPLLLEWGTYNASTVLLDGQAVDAQGSLRLTPAASTTYTLQVDPGGAALERSVSVEVVRQPRILEFSANPPHPAIGDTVQIQWEVRGADEVRLQPGNVTVGPISALQQVLVSPTQFVLAAQNEWGQSIEVLEFGFSGLPVIEELRAEPVPVDRNAPATLTWRVTNAVDVRIEPGLVSVPAYGQVQVPTDHTVTYTMTASNAEGTVDREVELTVIPVRIAAFIAASPRVFPGAAAHLVYDLRNATSAWIEPGGLPITPPEGTIRVVPPADSTLYVLHATDGETEVRAQQLVRWKPPTITQFTWSPSTWYGVSGVPYGGEAEFYWNIDGATSVRLDPGIGQVSTTTGRQTVRVIASVTYTLTASNAQGTATESRTVAPSKPVVRLSLPGGAPNWGAQYSLAASADNVTGVRLTPRPPSPIIVGGPLWSATITARADSVTTWRLVGTTPVDSASVTLTVTPAGGPVTTLTTVPAWIPEGGSSVLSWSAALADSVLIEPLHLRSRSLTGQVTVSPLGSTTYTLRVYFRDIVIANTATVTVQRPMVSLTAVPASPLEGALYRLEVRIAWAAGARLDPTPGVIQPRNWDINERADVTTTWRLAAWSAGDTARTTLTVVPMIAPPTIKRWAASPSVIAPGDSATLSWDVAPCDSIRIKPINVHSTAKTGTARVAPNQTTVYTLFAYRGPYTVQAQTTVAISLPAIQVFRADPATIHRGESATLRWTVVPPQAQVVLVDHGTVAATDSLRVTPFNTTDYILRATYLAMQVQRGVHVEVTEPGPPTEELRLVSDPVTLHSSIDNIVPWVPFDVYAVAVHPSAPTAAFGLRVEWPPCFVLESVDLPHGGLNFAHAPDYIVGFSDCAPADSVLVLARWTLVPVSAPGDSCLDHAHVVEPGPPAVTGNFALESCSTYTLRPFTTVHGITLAASGGTIHPQELRAVELSAEPLAAAIAVRWRVDSTLPLWGLDLYRSAQGGPFLPRTALSGVAGSWIDADVTVGIEYRYRLIARTERGGRWSGTATVIAVDGFATRLLANVPNPFNPMTEIQFEVGAPGRAELAIFDLAGRRVRAVALDLPQAGRSSWTWNGLDDRAVPVGSGVYVVRLDSPIGADTRRIALIR
jgi:hypothetical protein